MMGKMFEQNEKVASGVQREKLVGALNEQLKDERYVETTMLKLSEIAYQRQHETCSSGEGE